MRVRVRVPLDAVDIFLNDVTLDDVNGLLQVLDTDRNHPARAALYEQLQRAKVLMDRSAYEDFGSSKRV